LAVVGGGGFWWWWWWFLVFGVVKIWLNFYFMVFCCFILVGLFLILLFLFLVIVVVNVVDDGGRWSVRKLVRAMCECNRNCKKLGATMLGTPQQQQLVMWRQRRRQQV
jgi:hypothetical protein